MTTQIFKHRRFRGVITCTVIIYYANNFSQVLPIYAAFSFRRIFGHIFWNYIFLEAYNYHNITKKYGWPFLRPSWIIGGYFEFWHANIHFSVYLGQKQMDFHIFSCLNICFDRLGIDWNISKHHRDEINIRKWRIHIYCMHCICISWTIHNDVNWRICQTLWLH